MASSPVSPERAGVELQARTPTSSGQHRARDPSGVEQAALPRGAQIRQLETATPHKMLLPPCTESMCALRDVLITWKKRVSLSVFTAGL